MDARKIEPREKVMASAKLGAKDARALAKAATRLYVAKRGKVEEFKPAGKPSKAMVDAMLGKTGNLRTPTLRLGKTVIVGFEEELYEELF